MSFEHLKGTQVGEVDCPGCGARKPLKINAAGCVYMFCREPIGERNGKREDCFTRFNFGRVASEKMIEEYLKTEGAKENVTGIEDREEQSPGIRHNGGPPLDDDEPAEEQGDDRLEPATEHNPEHRGFADGLKHFLTGD